MRVQSCRATQGMEGAWQAQRVILDIQQPQHSPLGFEVRGVAQPTCKVAPSEWRTCFCGLDLLPCIGFGV